MKRIRIPVTIYLTLCCLSAVYGLVEVALHRTEAGPMVLLGPGICFAMIYGWIWLAVTISSRADTQLTAVVKYAMVSDELTKIMDELFALRSE